MQYLREFVAGIIHVVMCNDRQRNMKTILWLELEPTQWQGQVFRKKISTQNISAVSYDIAFHCLLQPIWFSLNFAF